MRLHLSIQRNALPTVDIVFSTGASGTSLTGSTTATIANLIQDVDDLVPLQTLDGEWCLDDYVVEVVGKQKLGGKRPRRYECLHFQPLATVLREDDEVIIRAMGLDELKARRIGGRVHTTSDGRPVVDGVVWGGKWIPDSQRPEVSILPRKKRRLLTAEPHKASSPEPDTGVDEDETSSSGSSESDSTSDSDSTSEAGSEPTSESGSGSGSGSGSTSESGSDSSSDSDSDSDSDASESGSTSSSGSDVESDSSSSSGSKSPFDPDTSSSEESEARLRARSKKATKPTRTESVTKHNASQTTLLTTVPVKPQPSENPAQRPKTNPPGQGLSRTKRKNERTRLKRRLKALQESGELPLHAKFADLRKYEEAAQNVLTAAPGLVDELEVAKARLLKGIDEMEVEAFPTEAPADNTTLCQVTPSADPIVSKGTEAAPTALIKNTDSITSRDASPQQATSAANPTEARPVSPVKRAKLNIAASRRLLFGSLGLRTPKNAAEEQALREKLSQNVGPGRQKEGTRREAGPDVGKTASSKSWKDKLIVGAVECVQENLVLPPPPFPFIQHWHRKNTTKESEEDLSLDYDDPKSPTSKHADQVKSHGSSSHVSASNGDQQQERLHISESRTISFETDADALPIPTNFEQLADLERSQALPGTVIAYKEIHVGADTNFQPQVSTYRVAEIESMDQDDWVTMRLLSEYRKQDVQLDPETGKKVSNDFEIESSQDEVDDGIREMLWSFLLEPKLVHASRIQAPGGVTAENPEGGDGTTGSPLNDDPVVPESLHVDHHGVKQGDNIGHAVKVEIDTPRRKEITEMIREAGFDSTMDQHLNTPLLGDHDTPGGGSSQHPTEQEIDSSVESSRFAIQETGPDRWISSHDSNGDHAYVQDADASSSPSVSLQLTVDYPHVSHLEGEESSAPQDGFTRNSSSHQDAQRVAPLPSSSAEFMDPAADKAESIVSQDSEAAAADGLESPRPRGSTTRPQVEQEENSGELSFLGRLGFDGADSSHPMSDADGPVGSSSDSSLPSLSELTSSQKWRIKKVNTSLPGKKQRRSGLVKIEKRRARSQIQEDTDDDAELPASSQRAVKVSASQAQQPRSLSQIPVGSQTVDLTISSSSAASPGNSDGEFWPKGRVPVPVISGENVRTRQTRAASGTNDDQASGGMGTKRFLTTRKKRTKAYF